MPGVPPALVMPEWCCTLAQAHQRLTSRRRHTSQHWQQACPATSLGHSDQDGMMSIGRRSAPGDLVALTRQPCQHLLALSRHQELAPSLTLETDVDSSSSPRHRFLSHAHARPALRLQRARTVPMLRTRTLTVVCGAPPKGQQPTARRPSRAQPGRCRAAASAVGAVAGPKGAPRGRAGAGAQKSESR